MGEARKQWEGQVVNGEFCLLQYLGGGEHSAVFLTEHGDQEPQKAAIKLIPADPRNAELQLSRWRLAAQLSHPHLIQLRQMGRCQLDNMELLYVMMEYAEEDLSQILPHRPLSPVEARDMLKPVLDALAFIHGKGFVHSHMKPANIMALGDQVKISSDGLSRMSESSSGVGKPSVYDPPEAAGGAISQAGDVWSLGMTLVEALTQRLPVLDQKGAGEPVLPEKMPAQFLHIARCCLRRDPQRRWTVADIVASLQQTSAVPQKRTPPAEPTARLLPQKQAISRKDDSTTWRYIVLTLAVGLILAAVLAGPRLLNHRLAVPPAPSVVSERPTVSAKPEQGPVTRETRKSTRGASDKEQNLSGTAPSPMPLRSEERAKAPTRGIVPGEIFQQVLPNVPQKARDTIRGTVRVSVKVRVDPSGSVAAATLDSPGPSKYFANLALEAARGWEFGPAKVDGRYAPSEWILRFEFTQTGTKVFPGEVAP